MEMTYQVVIVPLLFHMLQDNVEVGTHEQPCLIISEMVAYIPSVLVEPLSSGTPQQLFEVLRSFERLVSDEVTTCVDHFAMLAQKLELEVYNTPNLYEC
jgi:hypothetical protein